MFAPVYEFCRGCGMFESKLSATASSTGPAADVIRFPAGQAGADDKRQRDAEAKAAEEQRKKAEEAAKTKAKKESAEEADFDRETTGRNKGALLKNRRNLHLALAKLGITIRHNEFACEDQIEGLPDHGPSLTDIAYHELYLAVSETFGLKYSEKDFDRIVRTMAWRKRFHPVRRYLDALEWDGVERLDEWLTTYLGAKDDGEEGVNRVIGRIMLIGAVRRVRKPGCKFDTMLVLEGPQYAGKSSVIRGLCPDPDWFSDNLGLQMQTKEVMEQSVGKWLIEVGELAGLRRAEVDHVKSMLARQQDESRLAYGKFRTKQPRQCVFIATTNEDHYLQDDTGNRRFLPVKVGEIDLKAIARDRDQLWAEAAHWEAKDERIYVTKELNERLKLVQREREMQDEWEGLIGAHLNETFPIKFEGVREQRTTIADVAGNALHIEKARLDSPLQKRISRCMKRCGWVFSHKSCDKRYWKRAEIVNTAKED